MARSVPTSKRLPDIPSVDFPGSQPPSAAEIYRAVRKRSAQDPDAGVWGRLTNLWVEPPNPFNLRVRRPRRDAIVLTVLILATLGLVLYFNITAVVE